MRVPGMCTNCGGEDVQLFVGPSEEFGRAKHRIGGYCHDCDMAVTVLLTAITDDLVDAIQLETGDTEGKLRAMLSIMQQVPLHGESRPYCAVIDCFKFNPGNVGQIQAIVDTDWMPYRGAVYTVDEAFVQSPGSLVSDSIWWVKYMTSHYIRERLQLTRLVIPENAVVPEAAYDDIWRQILQEQTP